MFCYTKKKGLLIMYIVFNLDKLKKAQCVVDETGVIYMILPGSIKATDKIATEVSFMASKLPLEKNKYEQMFLSAQIVGMFETHVFYDEHMKRMPIVDLLDSHELDIVITGGLATLRD